MISNLERYKKDLERLIQSGKQLLHSIQKEYTPEQYEEWGEAKLKELPYFDSNYQTWYSEALKIIKQLIPDRENDFIKLYERPKNRQSIDLTNYTIEDHLMGFRYEMCAGAVIPRFQQQFAILKSAQKRFESSLFDIRRLLQADLFDSELDVAMELNKKGFVRAAGAVAGVVLENHLKGVCRHYGIETTKNPTIGELNQLLQKQVDTLVWSKIEHLGRLRNRCVHKKESEPTEQNVTDLIQGVSEIINTVH